MWELIWFQKESLSTWLCNLVKDDKDVYIKGDGDILYQIGETNFDTIYV